MSNKYLVDGWNNFCRVFEIPGAYPPGYCFGGGIPVNFQMVDWFYPVQDVFQAGVSKEEYIEAIGKLPEPVEVDLIELEKQLFPFLRQKRYVKPGGHYLILYSFGGCSMFTQGEGDDK